MKLEDLKQVMREVVAEENDKLRKETSEAIDEIKTEVKTVTEATTKENPMPQTSFNDEYHEAKQDIQKIESFYTNFKPKEFSEPWIRDGTPAQRFMTLMKGLKDKNESLCMASWALGPIYVDVHGKQFKEATKEDRLGCARMIEKDLSNAGSAGVLVPPDYRTELINCLYYDKWNIPSQTTRWMTDTGAETYAPSLTSGATVHWIGEGESKPESDPYFGQYTWTPKKQVCRTDITEENLEDSNPAVAEIVKNEHVRAMNLDLTYCFFYGDGVNQPRGIDLDIPAANTIFVGAVFNSDDIKRLKCAVRQDYRTDNAWFYAHDCVWCIVERFRCNGCAEWTMGINDKLTQKTPETIIGYTYYRGVDETMPIGWAQTGTGTGAYGHMFYGDPKNYIFVIRTDIRVKFNGMFDWDKNIVSFITEQRVDGRMICDSFSKLEGVRCTLTGV